VRTLSATTGKAAGGGAGAGDAAKGRQGYSRSGCAGCPRGGAGGSVFGAELTPIRAGPAAGYIRASTLKPSAPVPGQIAGVTVITRDGKRIAGVRVNEDTFSVQLRDASQNFRMFQKDEVQQVLRETKSLMPVYRSLSQDDLQNLLAYLDGLRGDLNAGAGVKKEKGIR